MAERAASTFLFVNANNSDNDDSSTFDSNDLATGNNQSRESDEEHASSYNSNSNENATSTCQQLYEKYGNSKKTLIAMCVGQKNDNGDDLVDYEQEPWVSFSKRDIKPTKQDYAREVKQRALIFQPSPMPRPSNWAASRSMEWLNDNPVTVENDVAFLKKEIARLSVIATRATISEENAGQPGNWRGPIPYLRLILCLIQDDIKPMYLRRADAITRQELDARNSEARPPTVFEKIAERWNNSNFNPQAPASFCHSDFSQSTNCSHSKVVTMAPAMSQKVEDLLTGMRSDLIRIIQNWERSGQGEGGRDSKQSAHDNQSENCEGSTEFGSLQNRSPRALQSRSAFLNGKPPYLLMFWKLADQHQILQSSLQRIDSESAAADAESAPSSSSFIRRRRLISSPSSNPSSNLIASAIASMVREQELERKSNEKLQKSAQEEAFKQCREVRLAEDRRYKHRCLETLRDEARSMRLKHAEASESGRDQIASFYLSEANDLQREIAELKAKLDSEAMND